MSNEIRFRIAPNLLDNILNNNFGTPSDTFTDTTIYIGLGIEFDKDNFVFSVEPVDHWYTVNPTPCIFSAPINGLIRNDNAIEWEKAKEDWTIGNQKIEYLGLYYKLTELPTYQLVGVLPLTPAETVKKGEKMVLNQNSIQIKLNNK